MLTRLFSAGHIDATVQPEVGVTYAPLLKKEDGRIDWTRPATQIDCQVRGLTPWPGTFTHLPDGQVVKVLAVEVGGFDGQAAAPAGTLLSATGRVRCGDGTALRLVLVQAPSGKKMDVAALINGGYIKTGDAFVL